MPFSFNAVELCVVTINEKPWTRAKEVCRALAYNKKTAPVIKAHVSPEYYAQEYEMMGLVSETRPVNWPMDSRKDDYYINEERMIELLVGSQQPLAKELAEYMGIIIIGQDFEWISRKRQLSIGSYRIDIYFPEHKLAIEYDEHDHKDRDIDYEIRRQRFIEDQLNCKFIRYNPYGKDFMIESVTNKIFQYIYQKHSS